jgi:hypothetical protein
VRRGNTYYTFFIGATVGLLIAIVTMFRDCNKPTFTKGKADTVTQIVTRPVTIRDTIRVKSVMVKYKDTAYFIERPIQIPCEDTAFIAQADSVITLTKDTINMAFNYRDGLGHFSLVFKPRPDSIQTITVPVEKQVSDYTWLPVTFVVGALVGIWGARP